MKKLRSAAFFGADALNLSAGNTKKRNRIGSAFCYLILPVSAAVIVVPVSVPVTVSVPASAAVSAAALGA